MGFVELIFFTNFVNTVYDLDCFEFNMYESNILSIKRLATFLKHKKDWLNFGLSLDCLSSIIFSWDTIYTWLVYWGLQLKQSLPNGWTAGDSFLYP